MMPIEVGLWTAASLPKGRRQKLCSQAKLEETADLMAVVL